MQATPSVLSPDSSRAGKNSSEAYASTRQDLPTDLTPAQWEPQGLSVLACAFSTQQTRQELRQIRRQVTLYGSLSLLLVGASIVFAQRLIKEHPPSLLDAPTRAYIALMLLFMLDSMVIAALMVEKIMRYRSLIFERKQEEIEDYL